MALAASAALGFTLLLGVQETAPAPGNLPARELPVSLGRIRRELKKPEPKRLFAPPSQADFSIQVIEKQRFQDLLSLLDFGGGPVAPGGLYAHQQRQVLGQQQAQPLFNVDLMAAGGAVVGAINKARRARAERLAREEVRAALIDFCAARGCIVAPVIPADFSPER